MSKIVIPEAVFEQHIILLGKTRSGKSSAMRYLVEHLLDEKKPVCIVDPKGDWWGIKSSATGKSSGYSVTIFGGEHGDLPLNASSGAVVAELAATENRPSLVDLGGWMPGDRTRFWIDFASTFFRMTRGRRWLVIDEVHNFCPKGKIMDPNAGKMLHWSNRLASEGLGKGVALIAASQRPQKVHNDFLTSCETLVGMRVIHKADRDAIKDWIDACGDADLKTNQVDKILEVLDGAIQKGSDYAKGPCPHCKKDEDAAGQALARMFYLIEHPDEIVPVSETSYYTNDYAIAFRELIERAKAGWRAGMQPKLDYLNNGWRERDEYIASLKSQLAEAERETALIEMAIEMGHEYGRTGTFRPGSPNGLPTPADVRKRYEERRNAK